MKRLFTLLFLTSLSSAAPASIINGSFETGDFTGWTTVTTGTPIISDWVVTGGGQGGTFGMAPTAPQDGNFVAWNGFDGLGPMEFQMYQDFSVPAAGGTLSWQDRVQWNFTFGGVATLPRIYEVELRDPLTNAVLAPLLNFTTGDPFVTPIGDSGWQMRTRDISAFGGSDVRLFYREQIPQAATGPGQIEFDDIVFTANVPTVPEPATLLLMTIGLVGLGFARRRKLNS